VGGWSLLDYFLSPCTGDAAAEEEGKEDTSDLHGGRKRKGKESESS
jgi:hypothetical protein